MGLEPTFAAIGTNDRSQITRLFSVVRIMLSLASGQGPTWTIWPGRGPAPALAIPVNSQLARIRSFPSSLAIQRTPP